MHMSDSTISWLIAFNTVRFWKITIVKKRPNVIRTIEYRVEADGLILGFILTGNY